MKNKSILIRNANVLDYLPTEMDAQPAPRVELTDLRISGDKIVVEFSTSISAALFSSENAEENTESLMLLMPIRLND